MKNCIYRQENIQLIMFFKDTIVQCLLMVKQDLEKHTQYKVIEKQIQECVIELYKIFLIEYNQQMKNKHIQLDVHSLKYIMKKLEI